jgi:branched-chain amino acid transport system ATP-binding protein
VTGNYGKTRVLNDVSLTVPPHSIVALVGPNGAGKTTLLRVASGLLRPTVGRVSIDGGDVTRLPPHSRVTRGLCLIPEGRGIFRSLTVRENIELLGPPKVSNEAYDRALSAFPVLGERLNQVAGSLSGGQQQMLALTRAYLSDPTVILLDEVSMGLAPIVVDEIFSSLEVLRERASLLIVEQYVTRALSLSDGAYLLAKGSIVWSGTSDLLSDEALLAGYLGGQ